MAIKSSDVVQVADVEAMVQAQMERNYGFRQFYRTHDASDAGNSVRFPKSLTDFEGDMVEIPEGSEYPRAEKEYGDVRAVYSKAGFEVPLTDEAVSDSMIDVELDIANDMAREEARRLSTIAFNVVENNRNATTGGDADGVLSFNEIIDARADHRVQGYEPDLLVVDPLGAADLLKEETFKLRDTPVGDRVVTDGFLGSVAGLDIFEDNSGVLGGHDAYMADSGRYGYESSKYQNRVTSYREESKDQTVFKISDRMDWVALDPDSAVYIDG